MLASLPSVQQNRVAEPGHDLASPEFAQITNTLNDGRSFRFLLRFGS